MRQISADAQEYARVPVIKSAADATSSFDLNLITNQTELQTVIHDLFGAPVGAEIDPVVSELNDIITVADITNPLRRDFLIYGDAFRGGVFCRHNDNRIRSVKTEGSSDNDIRSAPDTAAFPIFFLGKVYLIYPNGAIYEMNQLGDGGTLLTTNLNGAKTDNNIEPGREGDVITNAYSWLNRVWLQWAGPPLRFFRSEINKIESWQEVDPVTTEETGAGVYEGTGTMLGFATLGNIGLVFTDIDIYRVTIADIDVQFRFTPLEHSDKYIGGAITKENNLFYISNTGVSAMSPGGGVQHISSPIDDIVIAAARESTTRGEGNVSVTERGRYIVWAFGDSNATVIYFDSIDNTWSYKQGVDPGDNLGQLLLVGNITTVGLRITDLVDTAGNSLRIRDVKGTYDFYGTAGTRPCGVYSTGEIRFFDHPEIITFDYEPERLSQDNAFMVHTISLPEIKATEDENGRLRPPYTVWIEDRNYPHRSMNAGQAKRPNYRGDVIIEKQFSSPVYHFTIGDVGRSFDTLSRIVMDVEIIKY